MKSVNRVLYIFICTAALFPSICIGNQLKLEDVQGVWAREKYVEAVKSTRSPFAEHPETVTIEGNRFSWNTYHESAWRSIVRIEEEKSEGIYRFKLGPWNTENPSEAESELYDVPFKPVMDKKGAVESISFNAIVENSNEPFIRISVPLEKLVTQMVLTGSYTDQKGKPYLFNPNGTATWPEESFSYETSLDSSEASCSYFTARYDKDPSNMKNYGFKWVDGTLQLFNIKKDEGFSCEDKPFATLTPTTDAPKNDMQKPVVFNEESAMFSLFGTYNKKNNGVLIPLANTRNWDTEKSEEMLTPIMVNTYSENKIEKAVLIVSRQMMTEGEPVQSHGQEATISAYVYARQDGRWAFSNGSKKAFDAGAYGSPPDPFFTILGREKHGVIFDGGFTAQGITGNYAIILTLSEKKPAMALLLHIAEDSSGTVDLSESEETDAAADSEEAEKSDAAKNSGGEEESENAEDKVYTYSSKITFIEEPGSDYYVVKVTYSGTQMNETYDKKISADRVEYYLFDGEKYNISPKYTPKGKEIKASQLVTIPPDRTSTPEWL